MSACTLGNEIEPCQRLAGARYTRHEADGFVSSRLGILNDLRNAFRSLAQIDCARIRTGDLRNPMTLIKRLRRLNDGRRWLITAASPGLDVNLSSNRRSARNIFD